jgi:hypothetical protein
MIDHEELRGSVIRFLKAHGAEPTDEIVAACITTITRHVTQAEADRDLLGRLVAAILGSGSVREIVEEARTELGNATVIRHIIEGKGGDFERFTDLVRAGTPPDQAAQMVGGTGRPGRIIMPSSHARPPMSPVAVSPEYAAALEGFRDRLPPAYDSGLDEFPEDVSPGDASPSEKS